MGDVRLQKALCDRLIRVDAPIAKEGPVAARVLEQRRIDFAEKHLFRVMRRLRDNPAEGIRQETPTPELQSRAFRAISANVSIFMTNAVDTCDVYAIRD